MRTVIAAAIALFVGLVLGSLGPREELRKAEAEIATLQAKLDASSRPRIGAGLLNLGAAARSAPRVERRPPPPILKVDPSSEVRGVEEAEKGPDGEPQVKVEEGDADRDDDPFGGEEGLSQEERLEKARTALELRRTQARAALMERADLNDDQAAAFDDVVGKMNEGLEVIAEDVADLMKEQREPSRREAMHLAGDVLDVLIQADDSIHQIMSPDQLSAAGEDAADPLSYIDPSLVDLLQEL